MVSELLCCLVQVHADNASTLMFPLCVALTLVSCEIVWVTHNYQRLFTRLPGMIKLCAKLTIQIHLLVGGVGRRG